MTLRRNQGVSILTTVRMLTPETNRLLWTRMLFRRDGLAAALDVLLVLWNAKAARVLGVQMLAHALRSPYRASISHCMIAKTMAVDTPNRSIPLAASSGPRNLQCGVMIRSP